MDGLTMHRKHFAFTDGPNLPPCTTQFLESWFCHWLGQDFHFIPGSSTQLLHDWRKTEQLMGMC